MVIDQVIGKIRIIQEAKLMLKTLSPKSEEYKILSLAIEKDIEELWTDVGWISESTREEQ